MDQQHLIIFVKNPELGKVKTRLAEGVGDEMALNIYLQLLEITRKAVAPAQCTAHVFYSERIEDDDWDAERFNKHVQKGGSLGERMRIAFEKVADLGASKMVIIGSDCPGITTELIHQAFAMLEHKDVVIGPAKDGGYYLLGMKQLYPFLFDEKEWSTDSVFEDTVMDLLQHRLSYGRLTMLSDLDTIYDLYLLEGR